MELKFEKMPCRYLRCVAREVRNLEQTQELRLPDGLPDIGRVISAWGQVMLRSKEWRGDCIGASGGATVWVLYAPDDGTEPQCVEVWVPFQAKWNLPETDKEGTVRFVPLIRNVDARTVSARKLMIRVSFGIWAEALVPAEADIYMPGEVPEGVELLKNTYPVTLPKEAGEKAFLLDEELNLPHACPSMEKLLRYEMLPQLIDSRVMAGKVVFRGNGLLHILYRGTDGGLHAWDTEIPFSQFAETEEDFGQNAESKIALAVTNLELDRTESGALRLKCGLVCQYVILDQIILEIAEDAYSPRREVSPDYTDCEITAVLDERTEQLTGEISVDCDSCKVVDLSFMPDHPVVSRNGEQVRAEQAGIFQLLYEDQTGNLQSAQRSWEQEWMFQAADDSTIVCRMRQDGPAAAQCNGSRVDLKGNVNVTVRTEASRSPKMICGMELGEEKKPDRNRPSVILRRSDGERLWDLAKKCGSTVCAICQANGLSDEPDPGRILLIPVN